MGNYTLTIILVMNQAPHLEHEKKLWRKGFLVIGVDEVGRGALAGPVMAAACLFSNDKSLIKKANSQKIKIADSKKLTPNQRLVACQWIKEKCFAYGVGSVSVSQIDKIGIAKASITAMRRAIKQVKIKTIEKFNGQPRLFVLSDYFYIPYLKNLGIHHQKPIVHGDETSFSIASASIIAKVERDRLMVKLARDCPVYHWNKNKGYGVSEHRKAIKKHGTTKHHRTRFVRNIFKT